MAELKSYAGVARAPFLSLPVVLVATGASAALVDGALDLTRTLLAMLGLLALHVAVNVFNELSDLRTGIDLNTTRTPFSGGSGTLQSGVLNPDAARNFGVFAALTGLGCGMVLLLYVGWPLLLFMLFGAFFVIGYTDFLTRVGFGEIAAGLGLGGLPILGVAFVQEGYIGPTALAAAVPATLMTFNLLLLNEFPDEDADRSGGRRHLVILLGRRKAALIYMGVALLTPLSIAVMALAGALPLQALLAVLPSALLWTPLRWSFGPMETPVSISALSANVIWLHLTHLALALTLCWSALVR